MSVKHQIAAPSPRPGAAPVSPPDDLSFSTSDQRRRRPVFPTSSRDVALRLSTSRRTATASLRKAPVAEGIPWRQDSLMKIEIVWPVRTKYVLSLWERPTRPKECEMPVVSRVARKGLGLPQSQAVMNFVIPGGST